MKPFSFDQELREREAAQARADYRARIWGSLRDDPRLAFALLTVGIWRRLHERASSYIAMRDDEEIEESCSGALLRIYEENDTLHIRTGSVSRRGQRIINFPKK